MAEHTRVLTLAEVAESKRSPWPTALMVDALCDSHEALRAELDLTEDMLLESDNHIPGCAWFNEYVRADCRCGGAGKRFQLESTITRLRGLIEGMGHEFDCDATVRQSECIGFGKCNCIKSKVNL